MTIRLLTTDLWSTLQALWSANTNRMAAVAYVSTEDRVRFGAGDTLIVDASDSTIAKGGTSAMVLQAAHKRGAKLFHHANLHSKLFVCGKTVIAGSANVSANSMTSLRETAVVWEGDEAVESAVPWFEKLRDEATPIDEAFLKRALEIPVEKPGPGRRKRSLFELLASRDPLLKDMIYCLYEGESDLSTKKVKSVAREKGIRLPPDSKRWEYFEDPYTVAAKLEAERRLANSAMVCFEIRFDKKSKKITGIKRQDKKFYNYINCIRIKSRLVTLFEVGKKPPFDPNRDGKKLRKILTQGLKSSSKLAKKLTRASGWLISAEELQALFDAGYPGK